MKDSRKRDALIPEVLSNEIDNIDTYAQWNKTHYFINITPPKPEHGVTVSSKPDQVTSGQDVAIIVDYTTKYYDTTGELNQSVMIGSAMKDVVFNVSSSKKMLPDSIISGARPSGVVFTNSDRVKLTISGTPTSDDNIVIDPPIDKRCCVVTPVPNVGYEITADPTIVDELGTNNTAWFASKFNLIIRPDSGHEFVDENNIIISPKSMKDAIVGSFNKTMIRLEWDEVHGMPLSDFTIQAPTVKLSGYKVTINVPKGVERESGGDLIQNVTIGQEMTQVNLVAVEDLTTVNGFLPADHNTSKDGISINVDTSGTVPYKKAWVSGTPLRATTIDVAPLVVGYAVRITGGAHTSHVSGSLNQFVKAGQPIETVIFRCNDGYWFGKYNGGSNNSMSIKLNADKTELTLSGRPAGMSGFGDYDVRLEDAVEKPVSDSVKQGALLIMAPLTGTPVGNDSIRIRIKAPKVLNGTYGDFTFNNSDTAERGSTYSDRSILYDAPPGEYTATFTYEMSFDTKFTLTGNSSVIIDDSNRGSVIESSMIYILDGLSFGANGDFNITTGDTVGRIGFGGTLIAVRPDFPSESEVAIAQTFVNDLRAIYNLNEENLALEYDTTLGMGHIDMLYYGGVFAGTSFVIIDIKGSKRYRIATFVPYGN